MNFLFIAQQEQYMLGYALTGALVFLGYLLVAVPRPRKKAYKNEAEEKQAKKEKDNAKALAKRNKQNAKRKAERQKARKKKKRR